MNLGKILKKKVRKIVPVATREAIINAINHRKIKCKEIAKIYDVKYDTVKSINKKYKKFGNVQDCTRGGKPKMTDEAINIIKSEINKSSNVNLVNIKHKLKETQKIDVSLTTISRCIKKLRVVNNCKLFARIKYEQYKSQFQIQDKIISSYSGLSTKFDEIFTINNENDDIFQAMKPLLENFYNGYDGTIIFLGSSRSDNMYLMYGTEDEHGLFALIINHIYNDLVEKCRKEIIMRVSYMEITRDKIIDLLNPRNEKVSVVFNPSTRQSKFTNLQRYLCQSEDLALHVKDAGFLRRGPKSMKSHFVFRFSMEIIDYHNSDGIMTKSTISHLDIVDMQPNESPEFFDFIHRAASGESPAIEEATDCLLPVLCKPLLRQCQSIYLFNIQMSNISETRRILEDTSALRLLKHEASVRKEHVVFQEAQLSGLSSQLTELVALLSRPSDFSFPSNPTGHLNMIQALENDLKVLRDESTGKLLFTRFNEIFDYCQLIKDRLLSSSSRLTELERAVTTLRETFLSSLPKPRSRAIMSSVPKPRTRTVLSSVPRHLARMILSSGLKPSNRAVLSSVPMPRAKTILTSIPKLYNSFSKTTWVPSNTNTVVSDSSLHFTNKDTLISKNPIISTSIPTASIGPSTPIPTVTIGPPSPIPTVTIGPPSPIPTVSIGPTNVNPKYTTPIPVIKLLPEPPRVDMESESVKGEGRAICTRPINKIQSKPPAYCIKVVRLNSSTDK